MSAELDLTPSLKKIERANRKLGDVQTAFMSYVAKQPYVVRTELHGNMHHVIARRDKPVPDDISWDAVDAVKQLRESLDKMIVALVAFNGKGLSGLSFPFGGIGSDGRVQPFPRDGTKDPLKKKLTHEQYSLVMAQKPYPGGNDLLWAVNDISIEEKHRKDLVTTSAAFRVECLTISNGIFLGGDAGITFDCAKYSGILADKEAETILFSHAPGRKPNIEGRMAISLIFQNPAPVRGKEVRATLNQQIGLVESIVKLFGATFG